jgi:hypothetical protein
VKNREIGIRRLRLQPSSADEKDHQDGDDRDRQQRRPRHGRRLGERQRPEHAAFLRLEQEHRRERDDDDGEREEDRPADLFAAPTIAPGCSP